MEEVLCMRYELNEVGIVRHMIFGLLIVLILEIIFIMSRRLYNLTLQGPALKKYGQQKNNKLKIKEYANSEVSQTVRR